MRVGDDPADIGVGLGAVWVADHGGSLYRVDGVTLEVEEFPIGADVLAVAVDEAAETLWVYVGGRSIRPPRRSANRAGRGSYETEKLACIPWA